MSEISQKTNFLYTSLQKSKYWYTGISIKKFLKTKIFNLKKNFENNAINSGRYSAYCHYSQVTAFKNLLEKNHIIKKSNVLVHPLLPDYLVQILVEIGVQITFLDIDKKHLNFQTNQVASFLEQNKLASKAQKIDLVLVYGLNGLYEEIADLLEFCFEKALPVLAVIDSPEINTSLLKLFENLKIGSVLWNFGDSFLDDQFNEVLEEKLPTQPWFVSVHIETRTRAILEYHLSDSYSQVLPMIEAMLYILLSKNEESSFLSGVFKFGLNKLFFQTKFKDKQEAQSLIKQNYTKLFDVALPDVIFDLEMNFPSQKTYLDIQKFDLQNQELQETGKQIYDYFSTNLKASKPGSLEIVDFYLDRNYLKYFVYTLESKLWFEKMKQKGFNASLLSPVSNLVLMDSKLVNANQAAKYLLLIDII